MTWMLSVLLLAVMALATPHSQASPSVDAGDPLGDYGTDHWWSSPPPVALQCCMLPDSECGVCGGDGFPHIVPPCHRPSVWVVLVVLGQTLAGPVLSVSERRNNNVR